MGTWNTIKSGILTLTLVFLGLSGEAHAQTKKGKVTEAPPAPAAPSGAAEKVDISDLESKYWAPKDTDYSVVQNRTYTKEGRFFVSPQWGKPINDPYSEGDLLGVTLNYFWSERMGVQLMGFSADLQDNTAAKDIQSLGSGAVPNHGKLSSYYGVGFNFVPFYAKMSFWGRKIIYFDMAFTPTLGVSGYDQMIVTGNREKTGFTYGLDITQFFFFSDYFAIRADLKNQFRAEEVVRYRSSGGAAAGGKLKDETTHDTLFLLGLTFFY